MNLKLAVMAGRSIEDMRLEDASSILSKSTVDVSKHTNLAK